MTWTNALEIPGAELVARTVADPATWFDPVATYPAHFSLTANVLTFSGVSDSASAPPCILEVGVRLPIGFEAVNLRISTGSDFAAALPSGKTSMQATAVLLEDGGSDLYATNITGPTARSLNFGDVTTPAVVNNASVRTNPIILLARITITP